MYARGSVFAPTSQTGISKVKGRRADYMSSEYIYICINTICDYVFVHRLWKFGRFVKCWISRGNIKYKEPVSEVLLSSSAMKMSPCTVFDQVWADGSTTAREQSSVSSLSKSLTGEGSICPPVRWARVNDESVCLIGWEMKQHGKNEATYLLRWFNGGGVSPASSLWEHGSCFSWYCWPFSRALCPPPLQLCLFWMACLVIYHKGKGSSRSNKHVTALYFVFHREGRVLQQIWEAALKIFSLFFFLWAWLN